MSYTSLAAGIILSRSSIDLAGNVSTIVSYSWTIEIVPPTVTITQQPPALTNNNSASFTFTGSDNLTPTNLLVFKTSLDGAPFVTTTSPVSYSHLADGNHTFAVEAIDQAGNVSTAASYTWTIDTLPPMSSVTDFPQRRVPLVHRQLDGQRRHGPGIATFSVFLSDNGGSLQARVQNTTQTSTTFPVKTATPMASTAWRPTRPAMSRQRLPQPRHRPASCCRQRHSWW